MSVSSDRPTVPKTLHWETQKIPLDTYEATNKHLRLRDVTNSGKDRHNRLPCYRGKTDGCLETPMCEGRKD